MIKASGKMRDGRPLAIIGLSDENWARLRDRGQPIGFALRDIDPSLPDAYIYIIGGKDESSLIDDYAALGALADNGFGEAPTEPATKTEAITADLRTETRGLMSGALLPGEYGLATRFGVSRGTIRAALLALESEGLVRVQQGVGWRRV